MPGGWQRNKRRALPSNWHRIKPAALARDGYACQWGSIPDDRATYGQCPTPATDADHIGDPDDHRLENLRALCSEHHKRRSSAQGNTARWRYREKRPKERHPGLTA